LILQIENIKKTFTANGKAVKALDGVSLNVSEGELVTVNGPSGCGKTTLLLTAGGLLYPDEGNISLNGLDLYHIPPEKRAVERAENIGFVFQQFHLIPYLNVLENIIVPSITRTPDEERVRELIERFHLTERVHHKPSELSTGERQRVGLARALINNPKFLFADEPTGNLDDINAEEVMKALGDFASKGGGVLLVSHDKRTNVYSNRIYSMDAGKFI